MQLGFGKLLMVDRVSSSQMAKCFLRALPHIAPLSIQKWWFIFQKRPTNVFHKSSGSDPEWSPNLICNWVPKMGRGTVSPLDFDPHFTNSSFIQKRTGSNEGNIYLLNHEILAISQCLYIEWLRNEHPWLRNISPKLISSI